MNKDNLKFLFAGGGTGGHLFSGIAVADLIRKKYPEAKILFVGTPFGLEKEIVPKAGFPIEFIRATPLKGSGIWARLQSLFRLPKAHVQSKKILKQFKPDVVIGIGGYASGPMTLAAHFAKIPTAVIEQNSIPGFTNRQLARFVDKIFITFEKSKDFFPEEKVIFSGNPTRYYSGNTIIPSPLRGEGAQRAGEGPRATEDNKFTIFILGGSQGASALNVALIDSLPFLQKDKERLAFIHQTGPNDYEKVKSAYANQGFSAQVFPFLQDLAPYYAQANLMICRAGAGTITELQNLGLPSILIPYPFAADDHQLYNAQEMVEKGAAELILNKDLKGELVAGRILHYLKNSAELDSMRAKAKSLGKPNAAEEVLRNCLELIP